jgi:protease-4
VIVKERKLPREKVVAIADGRVFSGRKAKELGLVDDLGDMASAARLASKLAGKDGKYDLVYPSKKRSSVFDYLLESTASQISNSLKEKLGSLSGLNYLYYPVR